MSRPDWVTQKYMIELPVLQKKLTPTDLSQFIRLDRCERFLRLRLHERDAGRKFLQEYDVTAEAIPPILTRSGHAFEENILTQAGAALPLIDFAADARPEARSRPPDNARFLDCVRDLPPGHALLVSQPRLEARLDDWTILGDADLVRLTRTADGSLRILIVDIKSSARPKVEHRLQVCFYRLLIERLLTEAGIAVDRMETGILYRGGVDSGLDEAEEQRRRALAAAELGVTDAFLEIVSHPEAYLHEIRDLVTGGESAARRIADAPLDDLFFSLDCKCDGCLYSEFCLKKAHDDRDLSLVPTLSGRDKRALLAAGVRTAGELAALKALPEGGRELETDPEAAEIVRALAPTSAGPRIDELVLRARRIARDLPTLPYIPSKGHTTLPYSSPDHNPNLVRVHIDIQTDFTRDRVYLLGALIVGNDQGVPAKRRSVVRVTDGPPDAAREAALFADWIADVLRAVVECAAPDAGGNRRAPLHLIFWNDFGQTALLDALARNAAGMARAVPALYDFVTQMAAFDSPVASFLDAEIRERKNYPMLYQSLQAVAGYLGFDWSGEPDFRKLFRERLFDGTGYIDEAFVTRRSRHNSQIPLEYAYAAWGELPPDDPDPFKAYRAVSLDLLKAFEARRLEAIEHVANDFPGNRLTEKTAFSLPDLADFEERAGHLAQALREFVIIERHADLGAWRTLRQSAPEKRVLLGETLLVRYCEDDQAPEVAALNRDNSERSRLRERYRAEWKLANPDAKRVTLPKEQREESAWSHAGVVFKLRVECGESDCDIDALANLVSLKEGDRLLLFPRWTYDERLPEDQRVPQTPTPKQMLYGMRVDLERLEIVRSEGGGPVQAIFAHVRMSDFPGVTAGGFTFATAVERPFTPDLLYTLDPDPNDFYGYWQSQVCDGLCGIEEGRIAARHTLYDRVREPDAKRAVSKIAPPLSPPAPNNGEASQTLIEDVSPLLGREHKRPGAIEAIELRRPDSPASRFLLGLEALAAAGHFHAFEEAKRQYIGGHTDEPVLLVQGPPGTGKSYSTGFAILARLQAAMAEGKSCRVLLSCKTHAATDVLLEGVVQAREKLRALLRDHGGICAESFDRRLLDVPLFRLAGRAEPPEGVIPLPREADRPAGSKKAADIVREQDCAIAAATPGGIYNMLKAVASKTEGVFGHYLCDLLVLDEASQMSLPEAMIAALPLAPSGRLIVVGDPRQMPPIVKHDWESEPRRTFREYRAYRSLFETLQEREPPTIKFTESFRLHADMAAFLRREIYERDGIAYHSRRHGKLDRRPSGDAFVDAVLAPDHPLTVVVHDETASQSRNAFEQALITPVLRVLSDAAGHGLGAREGLGVVVPHRAQRIALRQAFPELAALDSASGRVISEAIDTVERYQGAERDVILVSATESDPQYLDGAAAFLLDPNRLTVALSRARKKMILVASRSIFGYFSPDEELFENSQIWKNLLRRACTEPLWLGERAGHRVWVWGNTEH